MTINPDAAALVREMHRTLPRKRVAALTGLTVRQVIYICGDKPSRDKPKKAVERRACSVCCDRFVVTDMVGTQCRACAQAPYLSPRYMPDDRDKWPFNIDTVGFRTFLSRRVRSRRVAA